LSTKTSFRNIMLKTIIYVVALGVLTQVVMYLFIHLPALSNFQRYEIYVQAVLILLLGYLIVDSFSNAVFDYVAEVYGEGIGGASRTIIRIFGVAFLLTILASLFNVSAATSLTVGSFSGLVVGFASQNVLSQVIAGLFLAISRPFEVGDIITVSGMTGEVTDINFMQTILITSDKSQEIMIPNNTVFTSAITKQIQKQSKQ
jgi:small conductance mechanosensitive channel